MSKYTTTYQTPQTRAALVALQLPTNTIKTMWSDAWRCARRIRRAEETGNFEEACRLIQMAWFVCGEYLTDLALEALDERDHAPRYSPKGQN